VRSLIARLVALEGQQPSTEPFAVQVIVCRDGTTVSLCYPVPNARTDRLTLGEYRAQCGETYRHLEHWIILGDAKPIDDRCCSGW
jgi:hypothetical protein